MVEIKKATAAHSEILTQFVIDLASELRNLTLDQETVRKGVAHLIQNPEDGIYYIAEIEGIAVGYLMVFYEWSDWRVGNFYYIEAAYVKPEFRNQGIFKKLFQSAYKDAENEKSAIRVMLHKNDTNLIELFNKVGLGSSHYTILEVVFRE